MTTDRELLEQAAKAAGFKIHHWSTILPGPMLVDQQTDYCGHYWNPLTNDGDALRLAVKLKLGPVADEVWAISGSSISEYERDPYAATRRAIVRAAAAIGSQQHD